MHQPADMPSPDSGPWWPRVVVLVCVTAGLVIVGAAGLDLGIVFAALGVVSIVGGSVAVIVRARRHHESLREAGLALFLTEYGRSRLEARSQQRTDRADQNDP